jgi:predicted RND superfamily exporter protein
MGLKRFFTIATIIVLSFAAFLIYKVKDARFDYNFEHFFPLNSDDASFYYEYRDLFEADNEFLIIGLEAAPHLFHPDFIRKTETLCNKLDDIKNIERITSPTNIKEPLISSFGVIEVPVINTAYPENLPSDSARIYQEGIFVGSVFSTDGKALSIFIKHKEQLEKSAADTLLQDVQKALKDSGFENYFLSGKIKSEKVYLEKTKEELILFMSISLILVVVFLWFNFKSLHGIMVPLVVVFLSIVCTIGVMTISGKAMDIMIILMPCILFVVGMSDVVHISSQYHEKLNEGYTQKKALIYSVKEVGLATFFTSATTAVAFITLNLTSIQPIRDFGTFTAVGVSIAFVLSITLLPFVLLHSKKPSYRKIHGQHIWWTNFLKWLFVFIFRHPKKIVAGFMLIFIFAIVGIFQIKINNSVLDDLKDDDPIKQEFSFFDEKFSGVRSFEMQVQLTDNSLNLLSPAIIRQLEKVHTFILNDYDMRVLVSPLTVLMAFNKAIHEGEHAHYRIPESNEELESLTKRFRQFAQNKEVRKVFSKDLKTGRFSGKMRDKGSYKVGKKNEMLNVFIDREINAEQLSFRITGSSDLIDKSNGHLTENILLGISINVLVLLLVIGIMFRSPAMMLLALLPNILPLVLNAGVMGWANIDMKVTISIIFSIAFGIAVDDTLHFLSRLRIELSKGKQLAFALRSTFLSTGKAMIITTLIICAGFASLVFSDFKSTYYVGLMISLTLLIALLADLILLPILIAAYYKRK